MAGVQTNDSPRGAQWEIHLAQGFGDRAARLAGGVGDVAEGDAGINDTPHGFDGARYGLVPDVERPVEVHEEALHVHLPVALCPGKLSDNSRMSVIEGKRTPRFRGLCYDPVD